MDRRTFCWTGALSAAGVTGEFTLASEGGALQPMKLVVGSDHAGFPRKVPVMELLRSRGHTVNDFGAYS